MLDCVRIKKIMAQSTIMLASNSPRRRELLTLTGWRFTILPVPIDETPLAGEDPAIYVMRLAESKAQAVLPMAEPGMLVLAADTIVVDAGKLLGKPGDPVEAASMLRQLRGHAHQALTALTVLDPVENRKVTDLCTAEVPMRMYTDQEIETYVASRDPLDKAGAYAIQNAGFHPVSTFKDCYACVMGLPLCHLARSLRELGIVPRADVPTACQDYLHYNCPVSRAILAGVL
jgi:septum formation protein